MADLCIVCVVCVMCVALCAMVRCGARCGAPHGTGNGVELGGLLVGLVDRDVFLARAPPRPLARNDRAAQQQLSAPDAPRLAPLECAFEAAGPRPAAAAERLGR